LILGKDLNLTLEVLISGVEGALRGWDDPRVGEGCYCLCYREHASF
jgi:hypothetical protein